ncbi:MAG: TPR domain protein [Rhodanobacteraceae bacterium]|jgi:tetratricopeptide (TPR) repeat protein|nr:MAG: TPR domain protein [Rhodanobacteraceae bacterium]
MATATIRPTPLPPAVQGLLQRAADELNGGQPAAASRTLAKVLALAPGNLEAIRLTGIAAQREQDHPTAIACFRQVLPSRPNDASLHILIGISLFEYGEFDGAITHLQRAAELEPNSVLAWFNLGEALKRQARTDEALAALQQAVRADPTHMPAQLALARAQVNRGQIDAAVQGFRQILQREPANADAWFGLANLNTLRFTADDVAQLRRAYARDDLPSGMRIHLGFALAKSLEDQGNYDDAFEVFRAVNALQCQQGKWDAAKDHARVEAILRAFEGWMPPAPTDAQRGREVIFIVSLPRSGSTLVEQILASHPEVEGANEIRDLADVVNAETQGRPEDFPLWIASATPADWQRLGEDYLARTTRWRTRKPRFTDKNLVTWYLLGTALAMLPAARFVIVRRDPVETCLACYRQLLSSDASYCNDLDDMADYCIDFMRLTRLWLQQFPERVLDLEYEMLVAEPEPTIRRLLDFCELEFDPACLAFHATSRTVMSAPSAAQVRQPLRRDTARAARYGHKLDGLRARLRAAGLVP